MCHPCLSRPRTRCRLRQRRCPTRNLLRFRRGRCSTRASGRSPEAGRCGTHPLQSRRGHRPSSQTTPQPVSASRPRPATQSVRSRSWCPSQSRSAGFRSRSTQPAGCNAAGSPSDRRPVRPSTYCERCRSSVHRTRRRSLARHLRRRSLRTPGLRTLWPRTYPYPARSRPPNQSFQKPLQIGRESRRFRSMRNSPFHRTPARAHRR